MRIPVIADSYGLYGWCADGVLEKLNHDSGSIVFGWTIWEWPQVLLTAEFHAVWESPSYELLDITPKPQGETSIIFIPDRTYPENFDFKNRPRNRRRSIVSRHYDMKEAAEKTIARMKRPQLRHLTRLAAAADKTVSEWVIEKDLIEPPLSDLVDKLIEKMNRRDELMDSIPGTGFIQPSWELIQIVTECNNLIMIIRENVNRTCLS